MTEQQKKHKKMRQRYHFMAQTGWLNDPNGLIYFKGKYHFFYQYNPYDAFWGKMHWGHAVSEDMMRWEYLPIALTPSEQYDNAEKGGCFSGSAIVHDDKMFLMYTGVEERDNQLIQTQCIAWSEDGITFTKYEGNPVIQAPEGVPKDWFRDPKIWRYGDYFYMVCGARQNQKGQALLYRSKDIFHWEFVNVLAENDGKWGNMWECPDFFKLGDRYVLLFSPIEAKGHTCSYMVGNFDYETGKFECLKSGEIDWGFDYYAPQTFLAPDGRRIAVSWANGWEWMPFFKDWGPTYKEGWCGFFNIPREVRLMPDHTLQFIPVEELKSLRTNPLFKDSVDLAVGDREELYAGDGVAYELKFRINMEETDADQIELALRCGEGKQTVCVFDLAKAELRVDKNNADDWSKGVSKSVLDLRDKKELDVHIYSDQSSLEIFTDQYRNNHSMNVFAPDAQNRIFIQAVNGSAKIESIESYGLEKTMI